VNNFGEFRKQLTRLVNIQNNNILYLGPFHIDAFQLTLVPVRRYTTRETIAIARRTGAYELKLRKLKSARPCETGLSVHKG